MTVTCMMCVYASALAHSCQRKIKLALSSLILFLSNKEVGKVADHWILTTNEGDGRFGCVTKLLCVQNS